MPPSPGGARPPTPWRAQARACFRLPTLALTLACLLLLACQPAASGQGDGVVVTPGGAGGQGGSGVGGASAPPPPAPASPAAPPAPTPLPTAARVACGADGCVVTSPAPPPPAAPGVCGAVSGARLGSPAEPGVCVPGGAVPPTAPLAPPADAAASSGGGSAASRPNLLAAKDGAKVLASNPDARKPGALLDDDGDTFMRNECRSPAKWVVVELGQVARVDTVELAQHELYSSRVRRWEVRGRATNPRGDAADGGGGGNPPPPPPGGGGGSGPDAGAPPASPAAAAASTIAANLDAPAWRLLGSFEAANARGVQAFSVPAPEWVRFLQLRFTSHHGSEPVCAINDVRAYGKSAAEDLEDRLAVPEPAAVAEPAAAVVGVVVGGGEAPTPEGGGAPVIPPLGEAGSAAADPAGPADEGVSIEAEDPPAASGAPSPLLQPLSPPPDGGGAELPPAGEQEGLLPPPSLPSPTVPPAGAGAGPSPPGLTAAGASPDAAEAAGGPGGPPLPAGEGGASDGDAAPPTTPAPEDAPPSTPPPAPPPSRPAPARRPGRRRDGGRRQSRLVRV